MARSRNRTVLYVEDDASQQKLVQASLRALTGVTVMAASDGFEALELARAGAPDLVLLDERLPRLSGSATFDALRALPGLGSTPIIFLTASTDPRTHAKLAALGAQDILLKPCRTQHLVQTVALALGAGASRREVAAAPGFADCTGLRPAHSC